MAENQSGRKDQNDVLSASILLGLGIIVLSTVVGVAWGNVTGNNTNDAGGIMGFLIGLIIVMSVALARTK